ncbi:MAG: tripartite tricarboxylate transporter substrate binding protein [Acidovorax sp.]
MDRRRFISASTLLVGLGGAGAARAQAPSSLAKKFIVPGSAGTGGDAVARFMARALEKQLGTPIIVDNKPGAGGIIGTDAAAKAAPDGSNFLLTTANHYVLPWVYDNVPYKAQEDFVPIAGFGSSAMVLVVSPSSPYATVQDLLKAARGGNADLSYSSAGNGTLSHICGALFNSTAGIHMRHVPYKAATQGLLDVSTGVVSVGFLGVVGALPLVSAGKLKILAVAGRNRSIHLPQVPTLQECGLKGYDIDSPFLALAPRGTPARVIETMEQGFMAASQDAAFADFCKSQGLENGYRENAAQLAVTMPREFQRWKKLIETAQAKSTA